MQSPSLLARLKWQNCVVVFFDNMIGTMQFLKN